MLRYEGLFLATPQITQDENKSLESSVDKIIKTHKGSVISFEKWGKFRLAYPVNKNSYGVYFLIRFDVPQGTNIIEDLKELFVVKLHAIVMRNMFTLLAQDQPLAYQRPKSLEEAPVRDVEDILKENKMTGFLPSVEKDNDDDIDFDEQDMDLVE